MPSPLSPKKPCFRLITNWKMYGLAEEVAAFSNDFVDEAYPKYEAFKARRPGEDFPIHTVFCPPFTALDRTHALLEKREIPADFLALGAQNCGTAPYGAYTGAVSPSMLKDLGVRYVILGHSERRRIFNETCAQVRAKAETAARNGLVPVICIGETEEEKRQGLTERVLLRQILESVPSDFRGFLSYEPVWAIGTGRPPSAEELSHSMSYITRIAQRELKHTCPLLYGGSVSAKNIAEIMPVSGLDGVLIGTAGRDLGEFTEIWSIAAELSGI